MNPLPLVPSRTAVAFRHVSRQLVAASIVFVCVGCSQKPVEATPPPSANAPTEQRWIIGAITKDLVNMTNAAADTEHWTELPPDAVDVHETAGAEPGMNDAVTIRLPGGDPLLSNIKLVGSTWSPDVYVPMLQGLFSRLKIAPPAPVDDPAGAAADADLLKGLANPLTAEIERRNQQISARLQTHPLDARAHEQAALLLGTLALRENAGFFWDPREICNRAAAHLAFARALRPDHSECGEVAELLIGLIIDTKADCQKRITALQTRVAAHPELGPWTTAAAIRNTRDYRLLPDAKATSLLERVERFRALSEAISAEQAIARTRNYEPSTAPDWSRIVLQAGYGVSAGHQFALASTKLELLDAAVVFPEVASMRTPDQYAALYNQIPGNAVQLGDDHRTHWHVIDRGTWARYFQRHLLQAADETYNFLQNKWGVPDDAKSFRVQVAPLLKRLTLYPLCLKYLGQDDRVALYPRAAELLNRQPQWVSDAAWAEVVQTVPPQEARGGAWQPVSQAWFSPRLPVGTVYGFDWRTENGKILPPPSLTELQKYYDIAPLKYSVSWSYMVASAPNHHATAEQLKEVMAPILPYYLPAIWGEAFLVKNDPTQYNALVNQAGTLDPGYYLSLGRYDLDHHLEAEAAQAYQNAIDHNADSVALSNSCDWLVHYYYDHGQEERALKIARQMAEVYSFAGLETMAGLMETMGRHPEAESYYDKIQERYNDAGPLHGFYARQAGKNPEYARKMKEIEGTLFPTGMEIVTLTQLSGKPADGVLVRDENELSRRYSLKPGTIIVGIDGKRVHSMEQYTYVRSLSVSPEMDLLVYQDGGYKALHASVPRRMFHLDFVTWP